MTLGERIRLKREWLGMTQKDLAKALGVTPQYISVLEKDKRIPSLPLAVRLARQLGVNVDYLATGQEGEAPDIVEILRADKSLPLDIKNALITLITALR